MSRPTAIIAVTALALAAAAPAPQVASAAGEPSAERQCFRPQTVRNYRTDHDTTAYVRDLRGQVFELQTTGCRGLSASRTLGISPQTGGTACVGEAVTVATAGPSTMGENNSVCAARVTRKLTEAEIEALPSRLRP
ncbi:MAG TPA: DUF6491 family protein [Brevundimonas sp.]|nr:DUF6491 family protein [Brevundimonas sp.]